MLRGVSGPALLMNHDRSVQREKEQNVLAEAEDGSKIEHTEGG